MEFNDKVAELIEEYNIPKSKAEEIIDALPEPTKEFIVKRKVAVWDYYKVDAVSEEEAIALANVGSGTYIKHEFDSIIEEEIVLDKQ